MLRNKTMLEQEYLAMQQTKHKHVIQTRYAEILPEYEPNNSKINLNLSNTFAFPMTMKYSSKIIV